MDPFHSYNLTDVSYQGVAFISHRVTTDLDALSFFQYEGIIAAAAVLFLRTAVCQRDREPRFLRWGFALVLAGLAYSKKSYELILAVEMFSYAVSWSLFSFLPGRNISAESPFAAMMQRLLLIAISGFLSLGLSHLIVSDLLKTAIFAFTPKIVLDGLYYMFPVSEMVRSYRMMEAFTEPTTLAKQTYHLLFVTFHMQVGLGYVGIDFLTTEQNRRNQLIRMDVDAHLEGDPAPKEKSESNGGKTDLGTVSAAEVKADRARRFKRGAFHFIVFSAIPYMGKTIIFGGLNKYAFLCYQHDLHRSVRLNKLFDHDNHLSALAAESPTSPEAYAGLMDSIVGTSYDIMNRKLFSLPKLLLLPAVMAKHPMLIGQVLPLIFLSDYIRSSTVAVVTTKVESLEKSVQNLNSIRSKVEAFDMKNAELLQRSGKGATEFTKRRWERLTVEVQARQVLSDLLNRSKNFFSFLQRNFVFCVFIDSALASLLAVGQMHSAEIFVYSRAVEDAMDLILTRNRAEAELSRSDTSMEKLSELVDVWERSKNRRLLSCQVDSQDKGSVVIRNLHYTRGTASVRTDHFEIQPGTYALTGANGSGKSTLFRVLMSCDTNEKPIDLPASINMMTPSEHLVEKDDLIRDRSCEASDLDELAESDSESSSESSAKTCETGTANTELSTHVPKLSLLMPSTVVAEISQSFYWPLYVKPIEYIYQGEDLGCLSRDDVEGRIMRVASELHALDFYQPLQMSEAVNRSKEEIEESEILRIAQDLREEKEDWFNALSGGQKSKVELVRKVFLRDACPGVLLIDETFAPLDPASKVMVMQKLKDFCHSSVVIVIYHADAKQDQGKGGTSGTTCVPSSNFFDHNIHLESAQVHMKPVCDE